MVASVDLKAKLFALGLGLFCLVAGGGYALQVRQDAAIRQLVSQCKAEDLARRAAAVAVMIDFRMTCDPVELVSDDMPPLVGIQKRIVDAYGAPSWFRLGLIFGLGSLVALCSPFAWSFLLQRVRELSLAIRGL